MDPTGKADAIGMFIVVFFIFVAIFAIFLCLWNPELLVKVFDKTVEFLREWKRQMLGHNAA